MNNLNMTAPTITQSFKIGNIINRAKTESINLPLLNKNIERRLNEELNDVEFELKHIESIFALYPDGADIYSTLFKTLHKNIGEIDELFFELDYLDQFSVSLLLEKIKKRIQRLKEKMIILSNFVYSNSEVVNQ